MSAAYYLSEKHDVVVFEKDKVAGGNVKTLNANVENHAIPDSLYLDSGVIEFHANHSPALKRLMNEIRVPLVQLNGGSTSYYRDNNTVVVMPEVIHRVTDPVHKLENYLSLGWTLKQIVPILLRIKRKGLDGVCGEILGQDSLSNWIRMLLMYGYSIPYPSIDEFPAQLAYQIIKQGSIGTQWMRIEGGVYSYIQAILNIRKKSLDLRTNQTIKNIVRDETGVHIQTQVGAEKFDRLVIATPPDQVLSIITSPTAAETALFSQWQTNTIVSIIHTDTTIYNRWPQLPFTEFDVFDKNGGRDAGYNAYLNRLSGLSDTSPPHYFLAFNLEDWIDESKILHRQFHQTPLYNGKSYATRESIRNISGLNHTFYAGAYLENGLHEGAIESGFNVSKIINQPTVTF